MTKRAFLALIPLILMSGCGYLQRHSAPKVDDVPASYLEIVQSGEFEDTVWWPMFEDSSLDNIIDRALAENLTVERSLANLDRYRAGKRAARATILPTVSVAGNYTNGESQFAPQFPASDLEYYDVRATAAYEIDLWGKLYSQRGAAYADLIASENDLRATLMTVTAQVGRTYFAAVELRAQQKLLEQTVQSNEEYLDLVKERYTRGIVTSLDVYQAQSNLAQSKARKAAVDASLATVEHALSVLLGKYPKTGISGTLDELPKPVDEIEAGLPSELMLRRPDVRAAHARLAAADLRWAAANADRFPRITLTGTGSSISEDLEEVLDPDNLLWNLVAGITMPLFESGRRQAVAQQAEAGYRELAAGYKQTLLNAFREVEDALVKGAKQRERIAHLETQAEAARNSLRRATDQYLQGISDYLPVLLAQTGHYNAQSSLLTARRELIDYRIDLATALGGGWTDEIIEEYALTRKLHRETSLK
ncbi:efflux transporter outer membrane subunit [bacterium]|nr:efflux transporter outer membrane subunit [bacterium]